MLKESANNQNNNASPETKIFDKENMICKDGFCSLPNQKEISTQDKKNIHLFDPI